MALDEVIGMNVAEVIKFYGYGGNKKDRICFRRKEAMFVYPYPPE